jgi:hypothetical protein
MHGTENTYPGDLIRNKWIEPRDQEEGTIPPLEKIILKAIMVVRGRKEDQKEEERITFRRYKNTEKIWDKKKKRWVLPIWTDGWKDKGKASCNIIIEKRRQYTRARGP